MMIGSQIIKKLLFLVFKEILEVNFSVILPSPQKNHFPTGPGLVLGVGGLEWQKNEGDFL